MLKVSVIIPAYNVAEYIEKAIKSALIQDEVEVMVVDESVVLHQNYYNY